MVKNNFYKIFDDLLEDNFDDDKLDIFKEFYDFSYFSDAMKKQKDKRDFSSDDVRGFGEAILIDSPDALIILLKLVSVKIATDLTTELVYREVLLNLDALPSVVYSKFEPWSSRLKTYLEKKIK